MGEMFVDFFTKLPQGATLRKFQDKIQENTERNPDVDMISPKSMSKDTSQECVVQNYI